MLSPSRQTAASHPAVGDMCVPLQACCPHPCREGGSGPVTCPVSCCLCSLPCLCHLLWLLQVTWPIGGPARSGLTPCPASSQHLPSLRSLQPPKSQVPPCLGDTKPLILSGMVSTHQPPPKYRHTHGTPQRLLTAHFYSLQVRPQCRILRVGPP